MKDKTPQFLVHYAGWSRRCVHTQYTMTQHDGVCVCVYVEILVGMSG